MSFRLREHTADVAVEAEADSLGGAFAAVADGMAAAMCDDIPASGERFAFEERAETREALLFDYLDRLIYERDVRGVLPVDNRAAVKKADGEKADSGKAEGETADDETADEYDKTADGAWVAEASACGVPLDEVRARDLKAVTYSEMRLEERGSGWFAYVVFDV